MAICFIDTETTGLKAGEAEIIEIALVRRSGFHREVFVTKVRMDRPEKASAKALEINGYNEADWKDAPAFAEVADKVASMLAGATVIAHNTKFDVAMLRGDFSTKLGRDLDISEQVDTIDLCKSFLKPLGLANNKLDTVREFLNWSKDGAHTALFDAETCERLYRLLRKAGWYTRFVTKVCRRFGWKV